MCRGPVRGRGGFAPRFARADVCTDAHPGASRHRPEQPLSQLGGQQPDCQTAVGGERALCRHCDDDAADEMDLPSLYQHKTTIDDCAVYWGKVTVKK